MAHPGFSANAGIRSQTTSTPTSYRPDLASLHQNRVTPQADAVTFLNADMNAAVVFGDRSAWGISA